MEKENILYCFELLTPKELKPKMKTRLLTSDVVKEMWKSDKLFDNWKYGTRTVAWNGQGPYYIYYTNEHGIICMGWTN